MHLSKFARPALSTDANGYVRFALLDYGTYHYEVRYTGDTVEFWGSDENISLQQPLITRSFTRNWPYKHDEELPSNPYVGEDVQLKCTVKNNLSYSRNVRVELWVDRNKSSSWDFYELSSAQTVSGNGDTKTFTFEITPNSSGTYYWKAYVRSWNDGSDAFLVTDTTGWNTAFTASYQTGSVAIYVENINGTRTQGCEVILDDDIEITDSSGKATFSSVRYGDYHYEVYYDGTGTKEFWGNDQITVDSSSELDTFRRNWPYKSSELLPSDPNIGQNVQIQITAKNNLSFSRNVKVELWVDRDKNSAWDFHELSGYQSISGSGGTKVFIFNIIPNTSGTHYWKAHILSWNDGAGNYIVTDTTGWETAFNVSGEPLPPLTGRIVFHRDSDNYNSPHPANTPDDGHVFVYNLACGISPSKVTNGLDLGNAMNPHFSPDGSKITFMAIPSGQSLSWDYMRVYVLDLADNSLSDLGIGQDPKFSPEPPFIIFKGWDSNTNEWQICKMQSDGSQRVRITDTVGEKSGPNYSPDGHHIVYWLNAKENADIWRINADGSGAVSLVANPGIQDYYPIYHNANNMLYAQWDSSTEPHPDKIYNLDISEGVPGVPTKLGLNSDGNEYEDADAFPVVDLIGFSSTRKNGWPDYDLYIAGDSGSPFGEIANANSTLGELGGAYSPYAYARKLKMISPADDTTLIAGSSYTLKVRAYSNGGVWSGANPSVTFQGQSSQTYTTLRDDGIGGDKASGDGIYSKTVTLPLTTGDYSVTSTAVSYDSGFENNIGSRTTGVTLASSGNETRIISLSGNLVFGSVMVGQPAQQTLTIYNNGTDTLMISDISYPEGFSGDWDDGSINPGDYQDIIVIFAPTEEKGYGDTITVSSNATGGDNTISCSGTGTTISTAGIPSSIDVPTSDGDGNYTVRWGASSTVNVIYVLEEATNDEFSSGLREAYSGSSLSTTIIERSSGTTYYYRVKATRSGYTDSTWRESTNGCAVTGTDPKLCCDMDYVPCSSGGPCYPFDYEGYHLPPSWCPGTDTGSDPGGCCKAIIIIGDHPDDQVRAFQTGSRIGIKIMILVGGAFWAEDVSTTGIGLGTYSTEIEAREGGYPSVFAENKYYADYEEQTEVTAIQSDTVCAVPPASRARIVRSVATSLTSGYVITPTDIEEVRAYWAINIPKVRIDPSLIEDGSLISVIIELLDSTGAVVCERVYDIAYVGCQRAMPWIPLLLLRNPEE